MVLPALRTNCARGLVRGAAFAALAVGLVGVCGSGAARGTIPEQSSTIHTPIKYMAADGGRVALITRSTRSDCEHVAIWTPATKSLRRFSGPARCTEPETIGPIALAGNKTSWLWTSTTGLTVETAVVMAGVSRPKRLLPFFVHVGADRATGAGQFARRPVGHDALLAFTVEHNCDANEKAGDADYCPPGFRTGDTVATTLYRLGGPGPCFGDGVARGACTPIVKVDGWLRLLAADDSRLAVATPTGVMLFTRAGVRLKAFGTEGEAGALSGKRLAVRTPNAVEVYETDSGRQSAHVAASESVSLQDLEGDLLVTASRGTITVRRLSDGRTITLRPGGVARGQLERQGLFTAGVSGVRFVPMRELLRRLG